MDEKSWERRIPAQRTMLAKPRPGQQAPGLVSGQNCPMLFVYTGGGGGSWCKRHAELFPVLCSAIEERLPFFPTSQMKSPGPQQLHKHRGAWTSKGGQGGMSQPLTCWDLSYCRGSFALSSPSSSKLPALFFLPWLRLHGHQLQEQQPS